jgi:hypothetical protein
VVWFTLPFLYLLICRGVCWETQIGLLVEERAVVDEVGTAYVYRSWKVASEIYGILVARNEEAGSCMMGFVLITTITRIQSNSSNGAGTE